MQCQRREDLEEDAAGLGVAPTGLPHESLVLLTSTWKQSDCPASPSLVVTIPELFHHTRYLCLPVPWTTVLHPQKSMWGRNTYY